MNESGVQPADLDKWRASCATALGDPEDARASPQATRADRKRIKALESLGEVETGADL
jgi:transposase